MIHTIEEVRDRLAMNTKHYLFLDDDISIVPSENKVGLYYSYPNIKFCEMTSKSFYLKKDLIEKFDFYKHVINTDSYDNKGASDLIRVDPSEEMFDKLFSVASLLFDFYLNKAEVPSFGCCSSFEKCSDNKSCINTIRELYIGCQYKKNLDKGKIFYGKNRTGN